MIPTAHLGMALSNVIGPAIMITTASTVHPAGRLTTSLFGHKVCRRRELFLRTDDNRPPEGCGPKLMTDPTPIRALPGGLSADELERAHARLAAIVASSEDAIVSKTLEGIVTSWNAAAERLFGFTAADMIGQSITRIIPADRLHEETEILSKLRKGERIERYETVRVHKNGREVEVSLTVSPVRNSSGVIVGAAKIAHDIGDRRRDERALRERDAQLSQLVAERDSVLESERAARAEAQRLGHIKDEFLATLSHELRTPLNAIQGWVTLLRRSLSPADTGRALDTIERNVKAQTQIVNDLLDMSRIISGKIQLDVRPLRLEDVIEFSLETVRQSAEAKQIQIQTTFDSKVGLVRGDANRLQQVFWNLLSNAIKFTPRHGRVQVVLERVNSHVEVAIQDSGVGIQPEFLPYVFDRFRQADPSTTRRYGGLGLGLSIVRSLVGLHGGSVRVKSPGPDQGSTFIVELPVASIRAETRDVVNPRADTTAALEIPRLDELHILVVDDEADGRQLTTQLLEEFGARVTSVPSAAEALEALAAKPFDILLSDIGMPDIDGYELIRQVRKMRAGHEGFLPAIAITAYARPEDRQRSLIAGFQTHLSKPLEAVELVASVASLVHLRGLREDNQ